MHILLRGCRKCAAGRAGACSQRDGMWVCGVAVCLGMPGMARRLDVFLIVGQGKPFVQVGDNYYVQCVWIFVQA